MDLKDLEEIIKIMEQHNLIKIAIKKKDFEVILEKEGVGASTLPQVAAAIAAPQPHAVSQPVIAPKEESISYITSPIVGTFYLASSPDDPSLVKVGDQVGLDSIVCIIEAMKVMNEVKSNMIGKVTEVLIKNGDPVEYGTKLFKLS